MMIRTCELCKAFLSDEGVKMIIQYKGITKEFILCNYCIRRMVVDRENAVWLGEHHPVSLPLAEAGIILTHTN
jgi:hypothetical protein